MLLVALDDGKVTYSPHKSQAFPTSDQNILSTVHELLP